MKEGPEKLAKKLVNRLKMEDAGAIKILDFLIYDIKEYGSFLEGFPFGKKDQMRMRLKNLNCLEGLVTG